MNNLKNLIVQENSTLKSILTKINLNGKNGVFVVKFKKLVGVITDSDIRKKLLHKKLSMHSHAKEIMEKNFLSIPFSKKKQSRKILIDSNKILIPIVQNNQLAGYVHTSDFYKKKIIRSKKILVIGGLGFIGSILIKNLLSKKIKVNILDINFYGCKLDKKIIKNKNLKIFKGDCNNKKILRKALNGCTDVVHLGEIVGDPAVSLNKNFSIRNNYESTVSVVSECLKQKINKFIFASSCSVYGESKLKCKENSKLNPVSLYARCKIECEKTILSFNSNQFCPVIMRLSTVYGDSPRKRFDLVVNRFILMAIKKIKINLYGGDSWRPFISVNDVSRAIIKTLYAKDEKIKKQIFNLGGNKENYRIFDIIKFIRQKLVFDYEKVDQIDDRRNYRVSFKKISNILSFTPKDSLKKSIFKLIKLYKNLPLNENNINYFNDKKIAKILSSKKK